MRNDSKSRATPLAVKNAAMNLYRLQVAAAAATSIYGFQLGVAAERLACLEENFRSLSKK